MALSLSGEEHLLPNKNLVLDGVAKVPQDPLGPLDPFGHSLVAP